MNFKKNIPEVTKIPRVVTAPKLKKQNSAYVKAKISKQYALKNLEESIARTIRRHI